MWGEMRDTAQLHPVQRYVVDRLVTPTQRRDMLLSWGSIASMLPKGWPAWDAHRESFFTYSDERANLTTAEAVELALSTIPPEYRESLERWYSWGFSSDPRREENQHSRFWSNPLETTLPNAPNMTIYCEYGDGIATEMGYHVRKAALKKTAICTHLNRLSIAQKTTERHS
eukprot:GABV01000786.1.p2 GENE.GABV01000786.1~~GABV01000786.1.p2  ORF type:complete len:171 (+),score=30.97 GABV01000786.1:277-789(+)